VEVERLEDALFGLEQVERLLLVPDGRPRQDTTPASNNSSALRRMTQAAGRVFAVGDDRRAELGLDQRQNRLDELRP
jgi:hypothetical protein